MCVRAYVFLPKWLTPYPDRNRSISFVSYFGCIKGTPGDFHHRVLKQMTSPMFRTYKMNLKYAISALKSNSFFCYSRFSKWRFAIFSQHIWPQEHTIWDRSMKFWEFEEKIKINKHKEGFLERSSFLAMRTVYFFRLSQNKQKCSHASLGMKIGKKLLQTII